MLTRFFFSLSLPFEIAAGVPHVFLSTRQILTAAAAADDAAPIRQVSVAIRIERLLIFCGRNYQRGVRERPQKRTLQLAQKGESRPWILHVFLSVSLSFFRSFFGRRTEDRTRDPNSADTNIKCTHTPRTVRVRVGIFLPAEEQWRKLSAPTALS